MSYIRNGSKVLFGYLVALLVFGIFFYVFLSLAKDNVGMLLPYYSFLFFLLAFSVIYSDMKNLARKEKKPQYNLNPYPLKGLIYGLIGFAPVFAIVIVSFFISFEEQFANRLKELAINTLLGPQFFILRLTKEAPYGYILACLVIPVISMLGYLAGYYNVNITSYLKKKDESKNQPVFKKSPWNPTNKAVPEPAKKKKKSDSNRNMQ